VSATKNMSGKSDARAGAGALMSNLVPVLSLFLIGYPLGRATIRTMLIGWILILAAMTQFIVGRCLLKRFSNEAHK
jgi:hypothetical protein